MLQLQRHAGNHATAALLRKRIPGRVLARMPRERLWPELAVAFGKNVPPLDPGKLRVAPGTRAVVTKVPPSDAVEVRIHGGEHAGKEVKVDPAHLEPAVGEFKANRRDAPWGWVWEVAPGIGVEALKQPDQKDQGEAGAKAYADFIAGEVRRLSGGPVGATMLGQFDPTGLGTPFTRVKDAAGPYRELTVVIGQPIGAPDIKTGDFGGRRDDGKQVFSDPRVPRISMPARPAPGQRVELPQSSPAAVTSEGVTGHPDFPGTTQPFDAILYHELVHSYLKQTGVADRLRLLGTGGTEALGGKKDSSFKGFFARGNDTPDSIEELLVVGVHGGKALPLSENSYRCSRGYSLRNTYKAVGVYEDPEVAKLAAANIAPSPKSIHAALVEVGLTDDQARYVAGLPRAAKEPPAAAEKSAAKPAEVHRPAESAKLPVTVVPPRPLPTPPERKAPKQPQKAARHPLDDRWERALDAVPLYRADAWKFGASYGQWLGGRDDAGMAEWASTYLDWVEQALQREYDALSARLATIVAVFNDVTNTQELVAVRYAVKARHERWMTERAAAAGGKSVLKSVTVEETTKYLDGLETKYKGTQKAPWSEEALSWKLRTGNWWQ